MIWFIPLIPLLVGAWVGLRGKSAADARPALGRVLWLPVFIFAVGWLAGSAAHVLARKWRSARRRG